MESPCEAHLIPLPELRGGYLPPLGSEGQEGGRSKNSGRGMGGALYKRGRGTPLSDSLGEMTFSDVRSMGSGETWAKARGGTPS